MTGLLTLSEANKALEIMASLINNVLDPVAHIDIVNRSFEQLPTIVQTLRLISQQLELVQSLNLRNTNLPKALLRFDEITQKLYTCDNDYFLNAKFSPAHVEKLQLQLARFHWNDQLLHILLKLGEVDEGRSTDPSRPAVIDDHWHSEKYSAAFLKGLFMKEKIKIPYVVDPCSIFFLLDEDNFEHAYRTWIVPQYNRLALEERVRSLPLTNVRRIYGHFMRLAPPESDGGIFGECFRNCVEARKEASECIKPCGCPSGNHSCTTTHYVTDGSDSAFIKGLAGKKLNKNLFESAINASELSVNYIHAPESDEFRIHKLRDVKTGKLKGAIFYNVFNKNTFESLKQTHEEFYPIASVKRSETRVMTAIHQYGAFLGPPATSDGYFMTAFGMRIPAGGVAADTLALYPYMKTATKEDRANLFKFMRAIMCVEALFDPQGVGKNFEKYLPPIFQKLEGREGFGKRDLLGLFCRWYLAKQHIDKDEGLTISVNLKTVGPGLFGSFAYTTFGVVAEIRENCLWVFDSSKLHGTFTDEVDLDSEREADQLDLDWDSAGFVLVRRLREINAWKHVSDLHKNKQALINYYK